MDCFSTTHCGVKDQKMWKRSKQIVYINTSWLSLAFLTVFHWFLAEKHFKQKNSPKLERKLLSNQLTFSALLQTFYSTFTKLRCLEKSQKTNGFNTSIYRPIPFRGFRLSRVAAKQKNRIFMQIFSSSRIKCDSSKN